MALRQRLGYIAHDTKSLAREIKLEPRTTPMQSPQSNGMAEAFVRTIKRDYVRVSPIPDARTVLECLPLWFQHDNSLHPHKALGYHSRISSSPHVNRDDLSDPFGGNNSASYDCLREDTRHIHPDYSLFPEHCTNP
jgi:Integrase core domain